MDFDDTPQQTRLRQEVRAFLAEHEDELEHGDGAYLEAPGSDRIDALRRTQAILFDAGYIGLTWPSRYGGGDGSNALQAIVNEELHRARVAGPVGHVGLGMCGPTVLAHGSEDQKDRYIRRLLRADDIWCQLFSEPGGGSDLAALRTKAVRSGDTWKVSGQKVWTTLAQYSRYGILLARTDPEAARHKGLTMFVIDMTAPGVTVRPLRQMNGHASFNEVFFDDVEIDDSERLGEVGDGWRVALTTLMNERMAVGGGGGEVGVRIDALISHAAKRLPSVPAARAPLAYEALGRVLVESLATRYTGYRMQTSLEAGGRPGPEASAGKLAAVRVAHATADLGLRLLGDDAVFARAGDDGDWRWAAGQASVPGIAIAGGTDEILRNVIAERVLGLPPDKVRAPAAATATPAAPTS
ncbi:acyl-CoA dehydrogenase family protein [Microbacterium trichothecenolyticum]|uniref:Glutaryl-CoA dehydrogenase n=1 Tax=Microbacterium trichothecenolyticum TaxID=69370 RepID=A0A0M2H725_MICTR|nr:acyl-CoA dehydrogenase family protein [Microbacterium trichothecenolyticum]KJL42324.1 Glutaryl-CoA dehydrogenase [Microbacterium trichothecenolyticum]